MVLFSFAWKVHMANHDYMLQQARRNIWCNPLQDNQFVIKPQRISAGYGAINRVIGLNRFINLPKVDRHYHVFQVGQLSPGMLNLLERYPSWSAEKWYTFSEAMNALNLYTTIYNEHGVNIPRSISHFMFTREKCLMFAIERDPRIQYNLDEDNIYFRVYTNAYFTGKEATISGAKIITKSYEITNMQSILNAQKDYREAIARPGHTEVFVNGFLVPTLSPVTVKAGNLVEWVHDGSVKRVVTFKHKDLPSFISTMDKKHKYILHYNDNDLNTIDFQDDVDLFISLPDNKVGIKGRYYPKNQPMAMRNLTHRDYSVPGEFVDFVGAHLLNATQAELKLEDLNVIMKIREGGYKRPVVFDANHIPDMYKMRDADIIRAMTGIISFPPIWHADNLEKADYTKVMRSKYSEIDIKMVEGAYGYDSMSQILANTPTRAVRFGTQPVAKLAEITQKNSTVYEFDTAGGLLGWWPHANDDDYEARNKDTMLIEAIVGEGGYRADVSLGTNNFMVPPGEVRVYYRDEPVGLPVGKWEDITDDPRYEITSGGVFKWLPFQRNYKIMVRGCAKFLAYDFRIRPSQGLLQFQLTEQMPSGTGYVNVPMEVPMGQLQVWLNGRNLVRDIDYVVNFPNVIINNFDFLKHPANITDQYVHVRFTGFCTSDMKLEAVRETGFVQGGALGIPTRYQSRDNKVLHMSVGGYVKHRDDLRFFETITSLDPLSPMNGRPYQIEDIAPPLKDYVRSRTWDLREKSIVTNKLVSDYLSMYFKPNKVWQNSAAPERWQLVSPFFSHIVYLLKNNRFNIPDDTPLTDMQVRTMCKPYEALFALDPLNEDFKLDDKFTLIRPHAVAAGVDLTRPQYRFLQTVVKLYGRERVIINNFVTFTV